jgi:hypothetical protein
VEFEGASTLGRFLGIVEIDPIDGADEPETERDASCEGTEDIAEEPDSLAQIQRLPETSMIATGVVRGRPLFRPRMVMSPLTPSGTPARNRALRIGLKSETCRGTRAAFAVMTLMSGAPSCDDKIRVVT